jgi:hypothetical protein
MNLENVTAVREVVVGVGEIFVSHSMQESPQCLFWYSKFSAKTLVFEYQLHQLNELLMTVPNNRN